jgi:hypothetical protein
VQLLKEGHAVARTGTSIRHVDEQAGAGGGSPVLVTDGGADNRREGQPDGEGATGQGWGGGSVGPHRWPLRTAGREGRWLG